MEINRDEKWLWKLKDSLGNWQEPAPADFWSNLEKDIPQAAAGGAGDAAGAAAGVAGDAAGAAGAGKVVGNGQFAGDRHSVGAAGGGARRRPAKYLYWAAAAAVVLVAAFLFVPQQEEAIAPAPGTKMAQNVPVPVPETNPGTKTAQNVPASVPGANPGTKTAQNVPEQAVGQPQQQSQQQPEQQTSQQADQQQQLQQQQQQPQPQQQPQHPEQQQQLPQQQRDAVREALYLAEEEPARRKWMAFSAGNGAFSASPCFGKGESLSLQDGPHSGSAGSSVQVGGGSSLVPGGDSDVGGTGNILDLHQGQVLGITNLGALDNSSVNMVGTSNNFYSFSTKEVYRALKYNHRQPVRLGVSFAIEVTRNLFLESGVSYEYLGSTMKWNDATIHQHLHYVGVPLKANLYLSKSDRFSVYAGAGFLIERCVYGTVAGKRLSLNHWQRSVSGSIGAQLFLGGRSYLYLEPGVSRYLGMDEDVISMQQGYVIKSLHSEEPFGITISGGVRILF